MPANERFSPFEHPVALGSFWSWLRLARRAERIDPEFLPRLLAVAVTTALTSPLRVYEGLRYSGLVKRTKIHPSPVFILGHWRTGTTHLHNLLCEDRQFGYLSTFQATAPGFCLMGDRRIKPLLEQRARKNMPTRIIDNIPLSMDAPQEESFALANMTPYASLHVYALPRQAKEIFERYALMIGLDPAERSEWTAAYLTLLRKVTLQSGGKRLVLKDPCHTGRIPTLLELFPEAKFLHICRDPYRVFRSTMNTFQIVLPRTQLQRIEKAELEELVLQFYERLMRKYLVDRSLIPAGNLVEVRYEDLEAAPMNELGRIYESLGLSGFSAAEPALRSYLASIAGYRKNAYRVDDEDIRKVNRRWQFALDEWAYPHLEPSRGAVSAA